MAPRAGACFLGEISVLELEQLDAMAVELA